MFAERLVTVRYDFANGEEVVQVRYCASKPPMFQWARLWRVWCSAYIVSTSFAALRCASSRRTRRIVNHVVGVSQSLHRRGAAAV